MLLAAENAAASGVADRLSACPPDQVPEGETYDEIWSNPPIRIGKAALHDLLDRQVDGVDGIKATARSLLSAASLIVSLIAALQLLTAQVAPGWLPVYWIGIGLTAVIYLALIIACAVSRIAL
mgnify:CR=1 FL=1